MRNSFTPPEISIDPKLTPEKEQKIARHTKIKACKSNDLQAFW